MISCVTLKLFCNKGTASAGPITAQMKDLALEAAEKLALALFLLVF